MLGLKPRPPDSGRGFRCDTIITMISSSDHSSPLLAGSTPSGWLRPLREMLGRWQSEPMLRELAGSYTVVGWSPAFSGASFPAALGGLSWRSGRRFFLELLPLSKCQHSWWD